MNEDKLVVIFMGSKKDMDSINDIKKILDQFEIPHEVRVLSAHKLTSKVLEAIEEYDSLKKKVIYIAVAGKSNALGPIIAGNSSRPVINCPVIKNFKEDIYSSLRMPSLVPCSTILEPKNAALHAIEVLALSDLKLKEKLKNYFYKVKEELMEKDLELCSK